MHLHQLIFRYLKQKRVVDDKKTNTFTSLIILICNVPAFVVANLNYSHTMILVYTIFLCNYLFIILFLFN